MGALLGQSGVVSMYIQNDTGQRQIKRNIIFFILCTENSDTASNVSDKQKKQLQHLHRVSISSCPPSPRATDAKSLGHRKNSQSSERLVRLGLCTVNQLLAKSTADDG